jgi:putative iron-dependent peroxidase
MTPQVGIFHEPSRHFYFLEFQLPPDISAQQLTQTITNFYTNIAPHSKVQHVLAFGPSAWLLMDANSPLSFSSLGTLESPHGHIATATQHDVLIWLHSDDHDSLLDALLAISPDLKSRLSLALETNTFIYKDSRDLTGFIDGSANGKTIELRKQAALIDSTDLYRGGSFVLTQKWVHQLAKFNELPVEAQEKVIGRTKPDSIEFEGDAMPNNSHVSRTDVKVDNTALKIYRRSAPFATANECGLMFIGFSCEQRRFQIQLERMFGLAEDGICDKLIDYSTAVAGSYWYAPSREQIEQLFHNL